MRCLLLLLLLVAPALAQEAGEAISTREVDFRNPPRSYTALRKQGWNLQLEAELKQREPKLAEKAATKLATRLERLLAVLPAHTRDELRAVNVFLLYGPQARLGGYDNGAQYFKSNEPDFYPRLDPRWRNALVVYCANTYDWLDDLWSSKLLCHELAHAFQWQRYTQEDPDILAAFANAKELDLYRNDAGKAAYAMTNHAEYFAELSCMYFVGCNYAPHNREELRVYDPAGYDLVEKKWGLK